MTERIVELMFLLPLLAVLAQTPEQLWAVITDPATPAEERMRAAERAKDVLPPRYIVTRVAALHAANNVHLFSDPKNAELRAALERVEIPIRDANGYDLVRDLPCATPLDKYLITDVLEPFPMTAETYAVMRNIVAPDDTQSADTLPAWWAYRRGHEWYAAQAFIADLAEEDEHVQRTVFVSELIATRSYMSYELQKMIAAMNAGAFPYTAFLALADRIDRAYVRDGAECGLAYDAVRLVQLLDEPFLSESSRDSCDVLAARFHDWLAAHRAELEKGAGAEAAQIGMARSRMARVTLCR